MSILSGESVRKALYAIPLEEVRQKIETGQIESLGQGIGIYPFRDDNLSAITYDLTVGEEAYSLRRAAKLKVTRESSLAVEPGETVLILTHEYVVLSPTYAALCVSRARIMNEGVSQSSAKIDPTWYGKLMVPVTNNTKRILTFQHGEPFCALLFFRLDEAIPREAFLNRRDLPFLGQTTLNYTPRHAVLWEAVAPDKVTQGDLDRAVDLFGPPFDLIRGAVHQTRESVIKYMEEEWSPGAIRDLRYALWDREIDAMRVMKSMLMGLWAGVVIAVLAWITTIAYLVTKLR